MTIWTKHKTTSLTFSFFAMEKKFLPFEGFCSRISAITWLILSLCCCTASNLLAQSTTTTAFTFVNPYTGLNTDQTKVLNYATRQPTVGGVQHIAWSSRGLFDNDGKITVALPRENGGRPISFEVTGSYFANNTDHAVFGRSALGEIALYVTEQGTGGSIKFVNSVYIVNDVLNLSSSIQYLM